MMALRLGKAISGLFSDYVCPLLGEPRMKLNSLETSLRFSWLLLGTTTGTRCGDLSDPHPRDLQKIEKKKKKTLQSQYLVAISNFLKAGVGRG